MVLVASLDELSRPSSPSGLLHVEHRWERDDCSVLRSRRPVSLARVYLARHSPHTELVVYWWGIDRWPTDHPRWSVVVPLVVTVPI